MTDTAPRLLLSVFLVSTGSLKLFDKGIAAGDVGAAHLYEASAFGEIVVGALLVPRRTSGLALVICVGAFLGAAAAGTAWLLSPGTIASPTCRCLGAVEIQRKYALVLQGLLVMAASGVLYGRARRGPKRASQTRAAIPGNRTG